MLSINPETVCYLSAKARQLDLELPLATDGNGNGDEPEDLLADRADDPAYLEL